MSVQDAAVAAAIQHRREQIVTALVALASAWGVTLHDDRIKMYLVGLEDLSVENIQVGCTRALRECRFFPSVSDIRQLAIGTIEDRALLAITELQRGAADVGAWSSATIGDSVAAMALLSVFGSWAGFCEQCCEGPAWAAKRQEFLAAYRRQERVLVETGGERHTVTLPGLAEKCEAKALAGVLSPSPLSITFKLLEDKK